MQLTVPTGDDGQLMSCRSGGPPVLWLGTNAVELTVPIGDDGQLMSCSSGGPPVLWLSTNAVQLTVSTGEGGQLMSRASGGPPPLWLSADAVQCFLRLHRTLFCSSSAFLFSVRQTFPLLGRFSIVPLFRSSDFSVPISLLFCVLLSARHSLRGGAFRSIGNFGLPF